MARIRLLAFGQAVAAWLVVLACACAGASAAAPQIAVIVQLASGAPSSYFVVQGQPGASAPAGSLIVENLSASTVVVQLEPVDALTTSTLGSAYQSAGGTIHGATQWLSLSTSTVTLAPHAQQSVAVAVNVPATAAPGDYLSGISVLGTNQPATPASGSEVAGQEYRYAVGVEVQLAGTRRAHLGFSGASVDRQPYGLEFSLLAHNDGNVILPNVSGHALITRGSDVVADQPIAPGTFVAGTSISMPVRAPGEDPAPGTVYRVRAELDYPGGPAYLDTLVTYGTSVGSGATASGRPQPRSGGSALAGHPGGAGAAVGTPSPPAAATPSGGTSPFAAGVPGAAHHVAVRRHERRGAHAGAGAGAHAGAGAGAGTPLRLGPAPVVGSGRSSLGKFLARALTAAVAIGKRALFPALLIAVMALFFLVQDRIDRRDPKLALAPLSSDPGLEFS